MTTAITDLRPPRIAQMLVLVAALLHWATPMGALHIYSNAILAAATGVAGFGAMMSAWWLFRKFDTAVCPTAPTTHLVTSGIFRFTRNPMYLGMTGMLLAVALYIGALPFYLVTAVFLAVMDRVFCPYEESKLAETLGDAYLSYKAGVRRWV